MKLQLVSGFILFCAVADVYADDIKIQDFQAFDDQISLFYGYSSSRVTNANNLGIAQTSTNQSIGLDVSKLYDNHVWFNMNGSFDVSTSQSNASQPFAGNVQNLGFPARLTGKVGYSILVPSFERFQIVPYATTGLVLNYNGMNIPNVGFNHSYYYLIGGGAFIEYIAVKDKLSLYFDQKIAYLDDQSGITANQDAMNYVSTIGLRYNTTSKVQLGLEGYYSQISMVNFSGGFDPISYLSVNNNQSTYGGIFSMGYLYDKKNIPSTSDITVIIDDFRDFDNVYSLGYGYSVSNNSNVKTNLNYLDLNINHLFDNQIWVNLNGQLATNISQINAINSKYANYAPTYLTYPGSATTSLGYAFVLFDDKLQLTPYVNTGIVMNINVYTISKNQSLSAQLSNDMYLQYGGGARLEYILTKDVQLYYDQLFAGLSDRSGLGLGLFRSNSVIGANYHIYEPLQIGFALNYQNLSPIGSPSSQIPQPVLLNQSTFGGIVSLGLRY